MPCYSHCLLEQELLCHVIVTVCLNRSCYAILYSHCLFECYATIVTVVIDIIVYIPRV